MIYYKEPLMFKLFSVLKHFNFFSIDMDFNKLSKPAQTLSRSINKIDELSIKKLLYLRFKLMNFMNNAHDLICNQVQIKM